MQSNIVSRFLKSAEEFADRPALEVKGCSLSYTELRSEAESMAATLATLNAAPAVPLTAVFGYRSPYAYQGVLASLLRGHGYVPLNRNFPVERTRLMLERSGCSELIVDEESAAQLDDVLQGITQPLLILCPSDVAAQEKTRWPRHRFVPPHRFVPSSSWVAPQPEQHSIVYLLFTSGSTGIPKGVMVTHANVEHYVAYIGKRYCITEEDRFSQMFDMTFDLSAADMFVAWSNGACVCCPDAKTVVAPGRFIRDSRLTVWFSVPSTAIFMKRLGMLKPGAYPELRVSMFCGEALPVETARDWQKAAPNSVVDNLYGPTELTIACTAYRWNEQTTPAEAEMGCVPIGTAFPGAEVLIADEKLRPVQEGFSGELLVSGPQQALGYWRDPERTAKSFLTPNGETRRFYRTGDRVRRNGKGQLLYLGRIDHQVKILGHRVELGEIEAVAREISGAGGVVALAWPQTAAGASGVELFVEQEQLDAESLIEAMRRRLPAYMVPKHAYSLNKFPLNVNGKYDRLKLKTLLESEFADAERQ